MSAMKSDLELWAWVALAAPLLFCGLAIAHHIARAIESAAHSHERERARAEARERARARRIGAGDE
jgi:hypothetical protein